MLETTTVPEKELEARLTGLTYQLSTLYERLEAGRVAAVQQNAAADELTQAFAEELQKLKTWVPVAQAQLTTSLQNTANTLLKTIGTEAGRGVVAATQSIVDQLETATQQAKQQLLRYQDSFLRTHWLIIGATIIAAALSALLIVKIALPRPMLPLSDHGVSLLNSGQILEAAWPHMTKKERDRLIAFSFAPDKKK